MSVQPLPDMLTFITYKEICLIPYPFQPLNYFFFSIQDEHYLRFPHPQSNILQCVICFSEQIIS